MKKKIFFLLGAFLLLSIGVYLYRQVPVPVLNQHAESTCTKDNFTKFNEALVRSEHAALLDYIKNTKQAYQVTPRGIYYTIINLGDGTHPVIGSKASIHYTLAFLNDSTIVQSDQPTTIVVGGSNVMIGIDELVQLLKPGGEIKALIPFNWAYGASGKHGSIPPYSPLVCTLELIEFENN